MATPAWADTESPRGDRYDLRLTFVDDDTGDPLDLTGLDFGAQLRRYPNAATIDATFDVDVTDIATGTVVFTIHGPVSAGLARIYARDVQAVDGSNDPVTLVTGTHTVQEDTTR